MKEAKQITDRGVHVGVNVIHSFNFCSWKKIYYITATSPETRLTDNDDGWYWTLLTVIRRVSHPNNATDNDKTMR